MNIGINMEKFYDVLFWILILVFLFSFIVCAFFFIKDFVSSLINDYNELVEKYDVSTAIIIDTHLSFTRFGTPCYYFVYKFSDGSIRQIQVSEEDYYSYEFGEGVK